MSAPPPPPSSSSPPSAQSSPYPSSLPPRGKGRPSKARLAAEAEERKRLVAAGVIPPRHAPAAGVIPPRHAPAAAAAAASSSSSSPRNSPASSSTHAPRAVRSTPTPMAATTAGTRTGGHHHHHHHSARHTSRSPAVPNQTAPMNPDDDLANTLAAAAAAAPAYYSVDASVAGYANQEAIVDGAFASAAAGGSGVGAGVAAPAMATTTPRYAVGGHRHQPGPHVGSPSSSSSSSRPRAPLPRATAPTPAHYHHVPRPNAAAAAAAAASPFPPSSSSSSAAMAHAHVVHSPSVHERQLPLALGDGGDDDGDDDDDDDDDDAAGGTAADGGATALLNATTTAAGGGAGGAKVGGGGGGVGGTRVVVGGGGGLTDVGPPRSPSPLLRAYADEIVEATVGSRGGGGGGGGGASARDDEGGDARDAGDGVKGDDDDDDAGGRGRGSGMGSGGGGAGVSEYGRAVDEVRRAVQGGWMVGVPPKLSSSSSIVADGKSNAAAAAAAAENEASAASERRECYRRILERLRSLRDDAEGVRLTDDLEECPDVDENPAFYEKITKPTCLASIAERVKHDAYPDSVAFELDVLQLLRNARRFFAPGTRAYGRVLLLHRYFNHVTRSSDAAASAAVDDGEDDAAARRARGFASARLGPGQEESDAPNVGATIGDPPRNRRRRRLRRQARERAATEPSLGSASDPGRKRDGAEGAPADDEADVVALSYTYYKGVRLAPGDWVHLANPADSSRPIVAQIFKIHAAREEGEEGEEEEEEEEQGGKGETKEGGDPPEEQQQEKPPRRGRRRWRRLPLLSRWLTVCWYLRPEQTVHERDQAFYADEVLKSTLMVEHRVEDVLEKVWVLFLSKWTRARPRVEVEGEGWDAASPLYICENRFNRERVAINKIKNWPQVVPEEARNLDERLIWFKEPIALPPKALSPFFRGVRGPGRFVDGAPFADVGGVGGMAGLLLPEDGVGGLAMGGDAGYYGAGGEFESGEGGAAAMMAMLGKGIGPATLAARNAASFAEYQRGRAAQQAVKAHFLAKQQQQQQQQQQAAPPPPPRHATRVGGIARPGSTLLTNARLDALVEQAISPRLNERQYRALLELLVAPDAETLVGLPESGLVPEVELLASRLRGTAATEGGAAAGVGAVVGGAPAAAAAAAGGSASGSVDRRTLASLRDAVRSALLQWSDAHRPLPYPGVALPPGLDADPDVLVGGEAHAGTPDEADDAAVVALTHAAAGLGAQPLIKLAEASGMLRARRAARLVRRHARLASRRGGGGGASEWMANAGAEGYFAPLAEETRKRFRRDATSDAVLWFAAPPLDGPQQHRAAASTDARGESLRTPSLEYLYHRAQKASGAAAAEGAAIGRE